MKMSSGDGRASNHYGIVHVCVYVCLHTCVHICMCIRDQEGLKKCGPRNYPSSTPMSGLSSEDPNRPCTLPEP